MTDHLLKEVDDALKLHNLAQLWNRHAKQIIILVSVAIIALIALLVWKEQQKAEQQRQSDILLSALTASKTQETLPDMGSLRHAHAQLALLLQSAHDNAALSEASAIKGGNDILAQYACLLASQTNSTLECSLTDAFAPLGQEIQMVHLLNAGDVAAVTKQMQSAIAPREPMAKRRFDDLRGYVGSSLAQETANAESTTQ